MIDNPIPGESDWRHPDWNEGGRVHNWRRYVSDDLRAIWETFTDEQKRIIALNADEIAGNEDWD